MFTALQRFYGALSNLDKFASANNLIDNVVCLDDFFSSFRSTSFVLQCALAHTEYEPLYDKFRQKYLKENLFVFITIEQPKLIRNIRV